MKIVMFYHSLRSDWNHGNAHFLRGVACELLSRGHEVLVFEPRDAWSVQNLLAEYGPQPIAHFQAAYPGLSSILYALEDLDLDQVLNGAQLVLVHEWNQPALVRSLGEHRQTKGNYRLFFHDTHHRMVSEPAGMAELQLEQYDGVLAYGRVLQELYEATGLVQRAWTWHEAADVRLFRPQPGEGQEGDVVWIGNWGDGERSHELHEFLLEPIRNLGLKARAHGVRYPEEARQALRHAGVDYGGWLPNFEVPRVFSQFKATVHIPRRPYVQALPGIPTIRPFEALACGIPLICSPWEDVERLFTPGEDFLVAGDGAEMQRLLAAVLSDEKLRQDLTAHGLESIRARHTCAHRVDQLLAIEAEVRGEPATPTLQSAAVKAPARAGMERPACKSL